MASKNSLCHGYLSDTGQYVKLLICGWDKGHWTVHTEGNISGWVDVLRYNGSVVPIMFSAGAIWIGSEDSIGGSIVLHRLVLKPTSNGDFIDKSLLSWLKVAFHGSLNVNAKEGSGGAFRSENKILSKRRDEVFKYSINFSKSKKTLMYSWFARSWPLKKHDQPNFTKLRLF